jgi:hypothetical protein
MGKLKHASFSCAAAAFVVLNFQFLAGFWFGDVAIGVPIHRSCSNNLSARKLKCSDPLLCLARSLHFVEKNDIVLERHLMPMSHLHVHVCSKGCMYKQVLECVAIPTKWQNCNDPAASNNIFHTCLASIRCKFTAQIAQNIKHGEKTFCRGICFGLLMLSEKCAYSNPKKINPNNSK